MRKFVIKVFFISTILTFSTQRVYAIQGWGSHVICHGNETMFQNIRNMAGSGDWYPVTVLVQIVNGDEASSINEMLNAARQYNMFPILRIGSENVGRQWAKLNPNLAASVLNSVDAGGFPRPLFAVFGNEVNMDLEWYPKANPGDYKSNFNIFAGSLSNPNIVPVKSPINLSFPPRNIQGAWSGYGYGGQEFYAGMGSGVATEALDTHAYDLCPSASGVLSPSEVGSDCVAFPGDPGGICPNTIGNLMTISGTRDIDLCFHNSLGYSSSPVIATEIGLGPSWPLSTRKRYLEELTRIHGSSFPGIDYATALLLDDLRGYIEPIVAVFHTNGSIAGYIDCNDGSSCGGYETCGGSSEEKVPRTIIGKITSTLTEQTLDGKTKTQQPLRNARICVYQGERDPISKGIGNTINNWETTTTTDEEGYFSVDTFLRRSGIGQSYKGKNYLAVFCGQNPVQIIEVDMNDLQMEPLRLEYYNRNGLKEIIQSKIPTKPNITYPKYPQDFFWEGNREIITPLDLWVKCPSEAPQPSFPDQNDEDPALSAATHFETGVRSNSCPQKLYYRNITEEGRGVCVDGSPVTPAIQETQTNANFILKQPNDTSERGNILSRFFNNVTQIADGIFAKRLNYDTPAEMRAGSNSDREATSNVVGFLVKGLVTNLYYPTGNNTIDDIHPCENIRAANKTLGDPNQSSGFKLNSQNSRGPLISLATPAIYKEDEVGRVNMDIGSLYRKMDKTIDICTLPNGDMVKLMDIQAPHNWLPPEERAQNCNPEIVPGCTKKLSVAYFPYDIVLKRGISASEPTRRGFTTIPENSFEVSQEYPGRRQQKYYPGTNDPDDSGRGGRTEVKFLSDGANGYISQNTVKLITNPEEGVFENVEVKSTSVKALASPVSGYNSTIPMLGTTQSRHNVILSATYCAMSELSGHNDEPLEYAPPENDDQFAAQVMIKGCIPGNPPVCDKDNVISQGNLTYLGDPISPTGLSLLKNAFNIFIRFLGPNTDPDNRVCSQEGELVPTDYCDIDMEDCFARCTEETQGQDPCELEYFLLGEDKYDCDGEPDEMTITTRADSKSMDASDAFITAAGMAQSILVPNFKGTSNLGTYFIEDHFAGPLVRSEEERIAGGIETPNNTPYTSVLDYARQAVMPPNTNKR
ncbi:hypothetical protein KBG31_01945 [Patescibacteria group bacterium]|nr:hypothetical protein [Patescibacteria group bacterium]